MTSNELFETLNEYAEWAEANEYEVPIDLSDVLRGAADEIVDLKTQIAELEKRLPRWISTDERLPEDGERVLALIRDGVIMDLRLEDGGWHDVYTGFAYRSPVATHWMPLPDLPGEGDTENAEE